MNDLRREGRVAARSRGIANTVLEHPAWEAETVPVGSARDQLGFLPHRKQVLGEGGMEWSTEPSTLSSKRPVAVKLLSDDLADRRHGDASNERRKWPHRSISAHPNGLRCRGELEAASIWSPNLLMAAA